MDNIIKFEEFTAAFRKKNEELEKKKDIAERIKAVMNNKAIDAVIANKIPSCLPEIKPEVRDALFRKFRELSHKEDNI